MDSYEWNRIAGWVLAAAIAVLSLSIVSGMVYETEVPETKGYFVEGVEEEAAVGEAEAERPFAVFLASANPAQGAAEFKKCAACHNAVPGGASGIGPNLYGIVGKDVAAAPGFAYSDVLREHEGVWDWEALNEWLENPRGYLPGNKMSFAGISDPQDRANLIAYLNTQSGNPLELPEPPAEVADPGAVPAGTEGEVAAVPPATERPAPLPGKAPDTAEGQVAPATGAQPQNNVGGPGAETVTGRTGQEPSR